VTANERYNDPDGCFSCHGLKGLQYIDKRGLLRDASIDQSHYYGSLHGSVPCKDCHRQIRYYPHKEENGAVDCAETCHVNEPSDGEAFTHKKVVEEFAASSHGSGATKGFTGANRLQEEDRSESPSCRRCHSNTAYIEAHQMEKFKAAFQHTDTECGSCHQGETWMNQLSGHILRRFVGARWKKSASNKICNDCHADLEQMQKVKLSDPKTAADQNNNKDVKNREKHPSSYRWQQASVSYAKSLHSRILVTGDESGASCLDCHAPNGNGLRHGIRNALDKNSPTHEDNLVTTCGQSSCHEFAKDAANNGFVKSDQHSLDQIPFNEYSLASLIDPQRLQSNWYRGFLVLMTIMLIFTMGHFLRLLLFWRKPPSEPILGSEYFKKNMLGRPLSNTQKKKIQAKKAAVKKAAVKKAKGKNV